MVGKKRQFVNQGNRSLGLLGQKAEFFVASLSKYRFNYKSEKINSIARLTKLGIPTVPYPHFLNQETYLFYLENKKLPKQAIRELRALFREIKNHGYNLTVRPSVFAPKIPGFEFIVPNTVNIPTFPQMTKAITTGYEKLTSVAKNPEEVEFVYLIQGFYTSDRCGLAQTEDGTNHIHIEAIFGEHTKLITRGEIKPDIYKVNKLNDEIFIKEIADKEFTLEPSKTGLIKVPLPASYRERQVLNKDKIKALAKYALLMEEEYDHQEIEWAVLRTGKLIFQATRNAKIKKLKVVPVKNIPIFPGNAQGELIFLRRIENDQDLSQKVVATDSLDIDFITKLTSQAKPAGIILTHGSLTAHAVTIIREAKIPSVLTKNLEIKSLLQARSRSQKEVKIKDDGTILFVAK